MKTNTTAKANGRVNLMGEHTDYNDGWVLPTSIPQYTNIKAFRRNDHKIMVKSSNNRSLIYELGEEKVQSSWSDYIQGVTQYLRPHIGGCDLYIDSNIPEGSGLASSAALLVCLIKALYDLFDISGDDIQKALLAQRIENEFVGAQVGIMDQVATSVSKFGSALFLDTMTLNYEYIPLPLDKMDLLVINSGQVHKLSQNDGGYNQRRSECQQIKELLKIKSLRYLSLEDFPLSSLSDTLARRARHVFSENQRVFEAVAALKTSDLPLLGRIFNESHRSMRDDYEVSTPEIDLLVELCLKNKNTFGARLTGGGFGGSIVCLTHKSKKEEIAKEVLPHFFELTGLKGSVLI